MASAFRWRLSDQRIRTKLALILLFPLLAIVTLAGLSVASAIFDSTSDSTSARQAAESTQQRDAARRDAGTLAGAVGVAVLGMIAFGAAVARSLTRSLTALSAAAETISHTRLPEMVAQVSAGAADLDRTRRLVDEMAEPIPVLGRDEVGQVATAFNAVTASAVRLAGEQAALRAGVQAIFNSVARRSQRRLNTVLASIDSLQANQTDPDQLTLLFQLDHAATGLRRLTAGLQVLAGGRAGLIRPEPMALSAVLRAAQSEIDQYQRIDIGAVDDDVQLYGETVEEVIHLLAELLDNAARFSAPNTLVLIDGRRVGDRLHIQIADAGKGMTQAQLAAARERIADPHRFDPYAAAQMGLPVVAAIADRLRITVEFRPADPQGTRVDLTLPPVLFRTVCTGSPAPAARELPAAGAGSQDSFPTLELPVLCPPAADPTVPARPEPQPEPRPEPQPEPRPEPQPEPRPEPQPEPQPEPEVYQHLKHAWFGGDAATRKWPSSDGQAAGSEAAEFTASGLPRRRPGGTPAPANDGGVEQRRTRDPEQLRRRYAGLDRGLTTARSRCLPRPTEEEQPR